MRNTLMTTIMFFHAYTIVRPTEEDFYTLYAVVFLGTVKRNIISCPSVDSSMITRPNTIRRRLASFVGRFALV